MFTLIRTVSAVIGFLTASLIYRGVIGLDFLVPDLILIALLLMGALLPSRYWSSRLMPIGLAFAAGVFSVSVSFSVVVEEQTNWRTVIGVVACLSALIALLALDKRNRIA